MNKFVGIVLVLIFLAVGAGLGFSALTLHQMHQTLRQGVEKQNKTLHQMHQTLRQSLETQSKQVQWDYMIKGVPDLVFSLIMTELGSAGWELVFARRAKGDTGFLYECIFKRKRRSK